MKNEWILNELEHSLLSQASLGPRELPEWEDIHVMYDIERHGIPGTTFADVVEALVKLFNMGLVECRLEEWVGYNAPLSHITKEEILDHFGGDLTEEEIKGYPNTSVYAFRATKKGLEEGKKDIYKAYYDTD